MSNQSYLECIYIIMQQKTILSTQEKSPHPFLPVIQTLNKHAEWLKKYQQIAMKPMNHFIYPSIALSSTYKKISAKLLARSKRETYFVSDIFFIQGYNLILSLVSAEKYCLLNQTKQTKQQLQPVCKSLQIQSCTQRQLLQIPLNFALNEFSKILEQLAKILDINKCKDYQILIQFVKWYNKHISCLKHYIEIPNEDLRKDILKDQYKQLNSKQQKIGIKYSFRLLLIQKLKQKSAKADKRLHERKMKILQLIDGEKRYIAKLREYITCIKDPIQKLNVLSQQQSRKIFSNIVPIVQFHQELVQQLQKKFANYSKNQTYGDIINKRVPFFRLYIDYILNVNEGAQKDLIKLQQQNQDIYQISRKFLEEKQKKTSDQLSEPTFRIARYQALFSQIIKKTNPDHPDYKLMNDVKTNFLNILGGVNKTVDKIIRRNRLNQLEQQFGNQQNPIFQDKREFLNEYSLFLIKQNHMQGIIMLIFSDLVMIIDQTTRKVLKRIPVDDKYYVRRQQDNKIYRNVIKIHSDGFISFTPGNQQRHQKKVQQIFGVLSQISNQGKNYESLIFIQVLGTEEIGSTSFAKHTQYVVQVRYLEFKKLLHLRFSDVSTLVKNMQNYYKDSLNITQEQTLKKTWFNNHKSKTIEDRKRTIEQILQKLFNHELVRKQPQFYLTSLNLDPDFFITARKSLQKANSVTQSKLFSTSKLTKKQQKEMLIILCATEVKLGRDIYHDLQQINRKKQKFNQKIIIEVSTMDQQQPHHIPITDLCTVEDVCNKVSKLIGLRANRDFRLFHEIGKKQLRVLDHQQAIAKIFKFPQQHQVPVGGFLKDITSSVKKFFSPQTLPTLIFKKYYFLPFEIEQVQYKKDLTRLRLLVYQIFHEVKDMKYQLSFDEYLLFVAMLIYIECDGKVEQDHDPNIIHKIIPQTIYKLKNYSQQQWLEKARPHLKRLHNQIEKIIAYNRQQLKYSKIKINTASKTALYFGPKHLCSQIVLNKIKSNSIYGSNLFYVQPYKKTYDNLIKNGAKMAFNMWLAIKVQMLTLLTPSSKEVALELHYSDIQKIQVYSEAIVFKMDDLINCQYRLNTYQSFEISQLVKYNKTLNSILTGLQEDQGLISKAKLYKQDILDYRNTDDPQQESFISLKKQ